MNDDDYLPPEKPRRKHLKGWQVLLILSIVCAAGVGLWYMLDSPRDERKRMTEDLRARAATGGDIGFALTFFEMRDDRLEIANELANDEDPKVRAVAAQLLVRGDREPDSPRMQTNMERIRFNRDNTLPGGIMVPALNALIRDHNAEVRRAAIRAANTVSRTALFSDALLQTLYFGSFDERLLVAEELGHWNGAECRRVFLSREQPTPVRVAAFRSAEKWRNRQFISNRFDEALIQAVADPDPEVRMLAVEGSRWVPAVDVVPVWLRATTGPYPDTARRALEVWIDELVKTDDVDGLSGVRIAATRDLLRAVPGRPGPVPPEVFALAGYVLCRAAAGHAAKLQVQNDRPEWRVKSIVMPLVQIPQELATRTASELPSAFTAWLPHETADGNPPKRDLAAFLLEPMKEPAMWIEKHRERWLPPEIDPGVFQGGKPQTVGTYADFHKVGTFADVEKAMIAAKKKP